MRPFLSAEWRWLVLLNYPAPARLLAPLVPAGTELDTWRGEPYLSVVGFRFLRTRFLGVPVPWHRNFDEVNLRFYVRREAPGGEVRRGVVFLREVVPRRAIALVARLAYNEPYVALPMRSAAPATAHAAPATVEYAWRPPGGWCRLAFTPPAGAPPEPPGAGTEEEFMAEHYWGYTRQRDGGTVEYHVRHPRWSVWRTGEARLDGDVASFYGPEWGDVLAAPPASAFLADGSPVTVSWPARVRLDR